jgi:hypothetical protein
MKNKLLLSGLLFALIGVAFVCLESTFYQYVDEDGLLHESLFMPLGFIFASIGFVNIFVFSAIKLAQFVRRESHER